LDIGCANGYLLECVIRWGGERGVSIVPYGLDLSRKLVALAKKRLPDYENNFYTGNAWDWKNPVKFKYVRTELVYVPEHLQKAYVKRIIDEYLEDGGRLLAVEYRSSKDPVNEPWIDETMTKWGFKIVRTVSGFDNDKELTRVAVVVK
jgi:trans-aconitate methyltransferase